MKQVINTAYITIACFLALQTQAQDKKEWSPLTVQRGETIQYQPDAQGNRVPDYSFAGYHASEQNIPHVPVRVVVNARAGDQTAEIQKALDYVGEQTPGGAVLLGKGVFHVSHTLLIRSSNIVLRGLGVDQTKIIADGLRETLIRVMGRDDKKAANELKIADVYVPVNAMQFSLPGHQLKAGDRITVHRPSTLNWIKLLHADHFGGGITALGWKPNQRDIYWDRTVTAVNGNTVSIDAPLTCALDTAYGGGWVSSYSWPGRVSEIGIENLSLDSKYNPANAKDEEHCWMAITMEDVRDAWVRQVNFSHFAGSAVDILETASRITLEDCISRAPISEIGGQRRYTFFTAGGQTLIQRCYAEQGYHDFGTGYCTPGPTAFVQCYSSRPYSFSGTVDSWSTGVLFDVCYVDGQAISLMNRGQDDQGAGWTTANSMIWQSSAARIDCYAPPGAQNYAYACWAQFAGDGYWENSNEQIRPRSLFYAQLQQRLNTAAAAKGFILPVETEASSSPSVEVAAELTKEAYKPALTMLQWIQQAHQRNPVPVATAGGKDVAGMSFTSKYAVSYPTHQPFRLLNGRLVEGSKLVTGMRSETPWWNGTVRPHGLESAKPHITRYVPGRIGEGLTDDLDSVANDMIAHHQVGIEHNYALWYDRRRDDHERIRRMTGEVWPPFYELPFERTGIDSAWDGLSKYDLTKYNKWYWSRLKQFANIADQRGLLLVHQNYFQHNIIEAGAHYVDFTWRPVNNINNTGFPEPVNFAGDKRVFIGEQFYDINNPVRRKLHVAYIEQCLNNFADNHNVIQFIGAEFTGPLHFTQFWLDVIANWEKKTGKHPLIGLSVTKDVQDSILADPKRAAVVDIVDIRQWYYRDNGTAYAPLGGQNLAPRQHARLTKPGKTSFDQVYRAVREYREKGKAVIYSADNYPQYGWAAFMAGGSIPNLPAALPEKFLEASSGMNQFYNTKELYRMADNKGNYIIYFNAKPADLKFDGPLAKKFDLLSTGGRIISSGSTNQLSAASITQPESILWIHD